MGNLTDEGLENYLLQRDSIAEVASEPAAGQTTHARKEINLGEFIWNHSFVKEFSLRDGQASWMGWMLCVLLMNAISQVDPDDVPFCLPLCLTLGQNPISISFPT